MTLKILRRARAKEDVIELADHIATDSLDAAERFIEAAETTFRFLADTPAAGAARQYFSRELQGIRMWPIRGFEKYLVFYRQIPEGLEIVRVIHSARDIEAIFEEEQTP